MGKDDGSGVVSDSGKHEGLGVSESHFDSISTPLAMSMRRVFAFVADQSELAASGVLMLYFFVESSEEVRLRFATPDVYAGANQRRGWVLLYLLVL